MKKKLFLIFIIFIVLSGCNTIDKSNTNTNIKDYTFLIYMNGSDLESENNAGTQDLYEMMKVGTNDNINIIIETGGTKDWGNFYIDPSHNQRWMINKNHMDKLLDLDAKNMGRSETLKDFITWGIEKYPANKTALILWNHGGGAISGFGYDEKFNYDTLLLAELETALKDAYEINGTKMDIIGFDACLMASLETANIVSPYADYLVASPELEPSIGWEYSGFLKKASESSLSGKELGIEIANAFYRASVKEKLDEFVTLSVIDTKEIKQVKENFEGFIKEANQGLKNINEYNSISQTISKSEYYGGQTQEEGYSNMIDLGDMAKNLSDNYSESKKKIIESVGNAVVYKIMGKGKGDSTGISVYFPYYGKENTQYELPIYRNLEFSKAYNNFLTVYTDITESDGESIGTNEPVSKDGNTYKATIKEKDISGLKLAHMVLGKELTPGKIILFGTSYIDEVDEKTGVVSKEFSGQWLSLNNHLMSFCETKRDNKVTTYSIPVILNNEFANIKIIALREDTGEIEYHIVGAWHGINPKNMVVRKEIIPIKKGDKIEPIYQVYDENKKIIESVNGSPFNLEEDPQIKLISIDKDDDYMVGFCLEDCAQNLSFSQFIRID